VAGTTDNSGSALTQSPSVACMSVMQSTAGNVVEVSANGNKNQNTSIAISAGSVCSYSMQTVLVNQKEGRHIDSFDSLHLDSNDLSVETSAVSSDATLVPLAEHKEPNEEVILVSCYKIQKENFTVIGSDGKSKSRLQNFGTILRKSPQSMGEDMIKLAVIGIHFMLQVLIDLAKDWIQQHI
jgi:hypothetical protein